jgi:lysophospholipase L1-like esterase
MAITPSTRRALQIGRKQAQEVLKFRSRALRKRAAALKAKPTRVRSLRAIEIEPKLLRAVGDPQTAGVLIAEGDSWFDYPFNDILRMLEDYHAYEVESVAHKGDRVEEMAYGLGQLEELTRTIEKLLRQGVIPKAILLSGGGNDVAGDEFGMLLEHAQSPLPGFNDQVIGGIIDQRVKIAYVTILSAVTKISQERLNRKLPILVHGYDYPVPDGRGFAGGWWHLPGPWLEPGFREKGYGVMTERIKLMKQLIDRFNAMLKEIAAMNEFQHVTYINLRDTLSTQSNYKRYWANELHPTERGFELVTNRFADVLDQLPAR